MSTLRISNIEAKSVPASATIDEKVKITNSSGDVLVFLDGKTSGITTVGINTTDGNITFDANSNVVVTGIITASKFVGTFEPTNLTLSGDLLIPDKIVHTGDTDTAIRFPAADTITAETGGSEKLRIDSTGSLFVGGTIVTESDMNWTHDTYQRPHIFSGVTGGNPSDGSLVLVSPETNPSNTRIGSLVFGCKTSSTSGVSNSGLKAFIQGATNSNVSDAWKTGGYISFHTRPDNGNLEERLRIDSSGQLSIGGNSGVGTKVHVENSSGDAHIKLRGSANYGVLFTRHSDAALTGYVGSGNAVNLGSSNLGISASLSGGQILFQTGGTAASDERLRIQANGDVYLNATQGSTGVNSGAIRRFNAGLDYWSGTAGSANAIKYAVHGQSDDNMYGIGISNSLLEVQSQVDIGFFAGGAGSGTGRRVERFRMKSDGNLHVNDGNLVIGTSGHGIDFSATGGPLTGTGGQELLDDYEEGTWQPSGFVGGGSLGTNGATYTKIGCVVYIYFYVANMNIPNNGNQFEINGLPFTVTNANDHYPPLTIGYSGTGNLPAEIRFLFRANNTYVYSHTTGGSGASLTNQNMRGYLLNQPLLCSGFYFTNS